MPLGIFQTKKREYNELILKSLVFGAKTTNQIAEYVYLNRKSIVQTKVNRNEVKTIVSIISRKQSRLEELESKGYIFRKDNLWNLTLKGLGVALTFFDSLELIYPKVKPLLHSTVQDFAKQIDKNPTLPAILSLGSIEGAKLFESPQFLQLLKDLTNELMRQGLDLDQISKENFFATLAGRILQIYLPKMFGLSY